MKERKYIEEIEGLMVEILYEYEEGDSGDEFTPPTGDRVTIVSWKLRDESREDYPDYDDEEWEQWMRDIDHYVNNDSEWDIIEFEQDLKDEY
jgi:hypothetical protein